MNEQLRFLEWTMGNYDGDVLNEIIETPINPTPEPEVVTATPIQLTESVTTESRSVENIWRTYQSNPRPFPTSRNRREPEIVDGWDMPDFIRRSA